MKRILAFVLCLAFVLLPVHASPDPPKCTVPECAMAILVLGVGCVAVVGLYRMCNKLLPPDTNTPPPVPKPPTNTPPTIPPRTNCPNGGKTVGVMGSGYAPTITIQSTASPASAGSATWDEVYTFQFEQGTGYLTAVALKNGVPVSTNTAPMIYTNGDWQAMLDFSTLDITNQGTFFRLATP